LNNALRPRANAFLYFGYYPPNPNCTSLGQLMPLSIRRMLPASSGGRMPEYEFSCTACKKTFSTMLTLAEYEKGKIVCPKCGSRKLNQRVSAFYAITSKKSA
jgi:putative FmdB family regulatory protein